MDSRGGEERRVVRARHDPAAPRIACGEVGGDHQQLGKGIPCATAEEGEPAVRHEGLRPGEHPYLDVLEVRIARRARHHLVDLGDVEERVAPDGREQSDESDENGSDVAHCSILLVAAPQARRSTGPSVPVATPAEAFWIGSVADAGSTKRIRPMLTKKRTVKATPRIRGLYGSAPGVMKHDAVQRPTTMEAR